MRSAGGPPVLRPPTATELAALAYLTIAVTAIVFIAWYGAMERLGVDRTGLFNGLIPVTSLAAVVLVGTGTITPLRSLGAVAVLAADPRPRSFRRFPALPPRREAGLPSTARIAPGVVPARTCHALGGPPGTVFRAGRHIRGGRAG